jgi:hypothetical protein
VAADKLGDYQDGFFCGLRCACEFGVRLAELGRRLQATLFVVLVTEIPNSASRVAKGRSDGIASESGTLTVPRSSGTRCRSS